MKLKKIASLALAGVMAVSMLAGCAGGKGENGTTGGNDDVTVTPTSIVKAVNDGQSALNLVKIDFTTDSKLETALQKAVSTLGVNATDAQVETAVTNMTGYESKAATGFASINGYGFLTNDFNYHSNNDEAQKLDGDVYTYDGVQKIDNAATEEFALNTVADAADDAIATLAKISNDDDNDGELDDDIAVKGDDEYYAYDYDGSISMVSVKQPNGTTDYWVAYVVTQTVTEKTLG